MTDVTRILDQIENGDPSAADKLLPLLYEELRILAAAKLANEKPGQTLQATGLVHDAFPRLVDVEKAQHWNSRGHFFGAAAEAMRQSVHAFCSMMFPVITSRAMGGTPAAPYCDDRSNNVGVSFTNDGHLNLNTNTINKAGAGRSLFIDFGMDIRVHDGNGHGTWHPATNVARDT